MKFTFSVEIARSPNNKQLAEKIDRLMEDLFKDLNEHALKDYAPFGSSRVDLAKTFPDEAGPIDDAVLDAILAPETVVKPRPPKQIDVLDEKQAKRREAGFKAAATRKANLAKAEADKAREERRAKRAATRAAKESE